MKQCKQCEKELALTASFFTKNKSILIVALRRFLFSQESFFVQSLIAPNTEAVTRIVQANILYGDLQKK